MVLLSDVIAARTKAYELELEYCKGKQWTELAFTMPIQAIMKCREQNKCSLSVAKSIVDNHIKP